MVHDGTPLSVVQRILYDFATKTHHNIIGNEEYVYRKCIELLDLCYNLSGSDSRELTSIGRVFSLHCCQLGMGGAHWTQICIHSRCRG